MLILGTSHDQESAHDAGALVRLAVHDRGVDVPDQPLTVKGVVTNISLRDEQHAADCDIWIENPAGERTTRGIATVLLPSRAN